MNGEMIAFFVLSMMAISGAVFMIQFSNVIHMSLSLAFTFFSVAGIYLLLNADFLAVVQILIYAGAISILMLFGIMLTKHTDDEMEQGNLFFRIVAFLGSLAVFVVILMTVYRTPLTGEAGGKEFTLSKLSNLIFKHYVIAFEVTSILLLVALVGAIILAKKEEAAE